MCGIFGCYYGPAGAAAEDWSPEELLQILFPAIVHRGQHAWGYMHYDDQPGADSEPCVDFFKQEGSATHPAAVAEMILPETVRWFTGHVRFATKGSPKENSNNHPIVHRNIVGVHNGVIHNDDEILNETGREKAITKVDSEAIFAAINKWGIEEGLKRVDGDMTATFTDITNPAVLYLARSHGRPLWYARTRAGTLMWASEEAVITSAGLALEGRPIEVKQQNRLMRVEDGRIVNNKQYAPPTRRRPLPGAYTVQSYSPIGEKDKYGGIYKGFGEWEVEIAPGHNVKMSAKQYIDWAVTREVAKMLAKNSKPVAVTAVPNAPVASPTTEAPSQSQQVLVAAGANSVPRG